MKPGAGPVQRVWREALSHGPSAGREMVGRRVNRWLLERLSTSDLPLRPEHIFHTAASAPVSASGSEASLSIGWVCSPPGPGSGGHTTLFRMVAAAEKAGHSCMLYLYDKHSDDVSRHEALIRKWWPDLSAPIASASADSFADVDALVASSWVSAHVVASRSTTETRKFYFIQDYEPYFYPRGSLYQLAESTYRFGFVNISLGEMVAEAMKHELGRSPEFVVPFGCDTDAYRYIPREKFGARRRGVAFYAKKNVPRRGYELGKLALEEFHRRHPDQPIHVFGEKVSGWRVPVVNHGTISPADLNRLYNSVVAGLTLSFTNVTLTASEMMAAGVVPVMNEFAGSKQILGEDVGIWSQPTPDALASALSEAVNARDTEGRALTLASRAWRSWDETSRATIRAIEDVLRSPSPAFSPELKGNDFAS